MARHFVMDVAAGQLDAINLDIAWSALLAAELRTRVLACRAEPRAGLQTVECVVKSLGVAWCWAFVATGLEALVAEERAAAFRALESKVQRLGAHDGCIRVTGATQTDGRADRISLLELSVDIKPHRHV